MSTAFSLQRSNAANNWDALLNFDTNVFKFSTSWPAVRSLLRWWWGDGRIWCATTWSSVGEFRLWFEKDVVDYRYR